MRWGCYLQRTLKDTVTPLCVWLYVCGYGSTSVLLAFVPVSTCGLQCVSIICAIFIEESNVAFPLLLSLRYRPKYWSMECIEMLRKLLLTSGIGIVLAMGDSNSLGEYEL